MQPGLNLGLDDYNNFDTYYNSNLFHPGGVDINDYEYLKGLSKSGYYVYVE
jgi:hypothetical protein